MIAVGRWRRILVAAGVFELLTLVAATVWWPVYESVAFVLLAVVTVTVGVAIGAAGARWSWPAPVVLGATVVAWLVLGVPLAVPAQAVGGWLPTLGGLTDLVVTTATGWRQLLTIEVPVGSYQALLVPVFVVLLVAAVLAVTVAARASRPAPAVAFPAVVLVTGVVFGSAEPFAPIAVGALFAVLALAWLVLAPRLAPPRGGSARAGLAGAAAGAGSPGLRPAAAAAGSPDARAGGAGAGGGRARGGGAGAARARSGVRAAAAVAIVAAGVAVAVLVAAALPAPDRSVARDAVEQPFDAREYPSPLAGFRAFAKPPLADAVVLTVTGAQPGERMVMARMADYDGVVYTVGAPDDAAALFARVPGRLGEAAATDDGQGATASVEVRVGDYESVWVPTVGDPADVTFLAPGDTAGSDRDALQNSLYFSPVLGTVADTQGLREGDAYTLSTRVGGDPAPPALDALTPGGPAPAPDDAAPAAVAVRLSEWAPAAASPGERLAAVVDGLRAGYRSGTGEGAVFSRSGHGADRIQELLTATPMLGDAEQYAVAGALLAEAAGFPARVAMGFTLPAAGASAATGDAAATATATDTAAIEVHGRDATAWTEVLTAEQGWVAIDPVPEPRPIPESALDDSSTAVQPPDVLPPRSDDLDDPVEAAPLQQDDDESTAPDELLATVLAVVAVAGVTLAVLAVLLAPFVTVLALKRRRRIRRRTRGTARARAAGGWAEVVDLARDAAFAPPPNATRREAAQVLGGDAAVLLAERVDGAVYAPGDPTEPEIDEIWSRADAERRRLLDSRGWFARLRARVSPRSLRTYHGKDKKRRTIR